MPAGKLIPTAHVQSAVPQSGRAPLLVTFLGHGHGDVDPLEHRWDFGGGSPPQVFSGVANHENTTPRHLYAVPGVYRCTLPQSPAATMAEIHVFTWPGLP